MNNREAHFYLEELQRMMTQHRGIFSEEFVCANGMAIQALERIQSVDAVPVIRCKECKHLLPNDRIAPNWWRICDYWRTGVDENEYCSRGERKKE